MARVLRMPGVASDTHEGVLSSWLVEESDSFEASQTIAYVETSTLLLSVEAGRPGVLLKTLVEPGSPIGVGMPIGVIGDRGEWVPDLAGLLVELGVNGRAETAGPPTPLAPELAEAVPTAAPADVAPEPEAWASEEPAPSADPEERPVLAAGQAAGVTAARLTHDHLRTTVRAERLVALAAAATGPGVPVTVEHLVVRAVAAAHRVVPELNVTRGPDGVRREPAVDVGLAIGTPAGLVVPVLRDVASRSLRDVAGLVAELTARAHAGRIDRAEGGGSIAISYLGRYGLHDAVPSVTAPRVASLAVGSVREEALVEGGVVTAGTTLTLTLSVDHDAVDDVLASRWLGVVAALLERPAWMHD